MPEIIPCPELIYSYDESGQEFELACNQPSEILNQSVLESTDGSMVHNRIRCLDGHALLYADLEFIETDADVIKQLEDSLTSTQ